MIPGFTSVTVSACNACVMQVSCGCLLDAPGEFYIPLQLSGCDVLTSSYIPVIEPQFPINIPALTATFDIDQVNAIAGNKLVAKKWEFTLPDFQLIKREWNQTVEKSQKYSVSLLDLINATRENRYIFAEKATAMLKEATDFSDMEYTKIKSLTNMFSDLSWLTKLGSDGTIMGASFVVALPVISLIMSLYVCCYKN